jgi:prepilin-type N-terminal cleavage/methylation domain-containing protein
MTKYCGLAAKIRKIRSLYREQAGYSLVELLAVLAIGSIIGLGALMSNYQVINQTEKNNDYATANQQVLNAIQWISRDAQMAQDIQGASGFPAGSNLTIYWMTWDNVPTEVVYYVDNGLLKRNYTTGNATTQNTLIAQYINVDPASSSCSWDGHELILTLTATVGGGTRAINITQQKVIIPRPIL